MKIRTDFVTNSSSSSYCTIWISADGYRFYELVDQDCLDFMPFIFSDPTSELENIKSPSDLLDIILTSLGARKGCLGDKYERELSEWLASIDDVSQLNSLLIYANNEGWPEEDWDWDEEDREAEFFYDFKPNVRSGDHQIHLDLSFFGPDEDLATAINLIGDSFPVNSSPCNGELHLDQSLGTAEGLEDVSECIDCLITATLDRIPSIHAAASIYVDDPLEEGWEKISVFVFDRDDPVELYMDDSIEELMHWYHCYEKIESEWKAFRCELRKGNFAYDYDREGIQRALGWFYSY